MSEKQPPPSSMNDVRVFIAQGRLDEALAAVDGQLVEDARDVEALLLKAAILTERRQDEAALELCQRAVAMSPRSSEALNVLARCLHGLGRDEEALAAAERARDLLKEGDNFHQTSAVYLTLVWCLRELRRYPEAVATAEEGLLRCPDAVLAQWATVVEEELAESERDEC
jgi:tetratricopeptide (TPR) repeat protein